jgi:hypothetical protein
MQLKEHSVLEPQQPEASSSRVTLDNPQPLTRNDIPFDKLNHVHLSFGATRVHYTINDTDAQKYLKACNQTLYDLKSAKERASYDASYQRLETLYHQGDKLNAYKNDQDFKGIVDSFKRQLVTEGIIIDA